MDSRYSTADSEAWFYFVFCLRRLPNRTPREKGAEDGTRSRVDLTYNYTRVFVTFYALKKKTIFFPVCGDCQKVVTFGPALEKTKIIFMAHTITIINGRTLLNRVLNAMRRTLSRSSSGFDDIYHCHFGNLIPVITLEITCFIVIAQIIIKQKVRSLKICQKHGIIMEQHRNEFCHMFKRKNLRMCEHSRPR